MYFLVRVDNMCTFRQQYCISNVYCFPYIHVPLSGKTIGALLYQYLKCLLFCICPRVWVNNKYVHVYIANIALLFVNISRCLHLGGYLYIGSNFERSISASDPIKYVPLFDNISRYLLLHRNPDFNVNWHMHIYSAICTSVGLIDMCTIIGQFKNIYSLTWILGLEFIVYMYAYLYRNHVWRYFPFLAISWGIIWCILKHDMSGLISIFLLVRLT